MLALQKIAIIKCAFFAIIHSDVFFCRNFELHTHMNSRSKSNFTLDIDFGTDNIGKPFYNGHAKTGPLQPALRRILFTRKFFENML